MVGWGNIVSSNIDALRRIGTVVVKRLLKRDRKKPGFKFNPESSLINLQTTGPIASEIFPMHLYRIIIFVWPTELII